MKLDLITIGLLLAVAVLGLMYFSPGTVVDFMDSTIADGKLVNSGVLIQNLEGDHAHIFTLTAEKTETKCSTAANFMRPIQAGDMIQQWPFFMGTETGKIVSTIGPDTRVATYDIDLFKLQLYSIPHCVKPGSYQLKVMLTDKSDQVVETGAVGVTVA